MGGAQAEDVSFSSAEWILVLAVAFAAQHGPRALLETGFNPAAKTSYQEVNSMTAPVGGVVPMGSPRGNHPLVAAPVLGVQPKAFYPP